jgi:hypothetical protein
MALGQFVISCPILSLSSTLPRTAKTLARHWQKHAYPCLSHDHDMKQYPRSVRRSDAPYKKYISDLFSCEEGGGFDGPHTVPHGRRYLMYLPHFVRFQKLSCPFLPSETFFRMRAFSRCLRMSRACLRCFMSSGSFPILFINSVVVSCSRRPKALT